MIFVENIVVDLLLIFCAAANMEIPVVEYLREGYRIRKIFGEKSTVVK